MSFHFFTIDFQWAASKHGQWTYKIDNKINFRQFSTLPSDKNSLRNQTTTTTKWKNNRNAIVIAAHLSLSSATSHLFIELIIR